MTLAKRDSELLDLIRAEVKAHGVVPSLAELAAMMGLKSKTTIHRMIDRLVWGKYLARVPGRARGLQVLQTDYYHTHDCKCAGCDRVRYLRDLELVQALQVAPKLPGNIKLVGIKVLSHSVSLSWLRHDAGGKPSLFTTKALKHVAHQHPGRGV